MTYSILTSSVQKTSVEMFLCFFNNVRTHSHSKDIQPRSQDKACTHPYKKQKMV